MNVRAAACLVVLLPVAAIAAPSAKEGRKLVQTHKCESCHQEKVSGPTGTIYLRKDRKVTTWAKLKAQVAFCNSQLNTGLFPDDEEHVAAFLNATYYKLPKK